MCVCVCVLGQWLRLGLGVSVRQVVVMVMVRVSLQEINVSLCNVPKSDLGRRVYVCVWDHICCVPLYN